MLNIFVYKEQFFPKTYHKDLLKNKTIYFLHVKFFRHCTGLTFLIKLWFLHQLAVCFFFCTRFLSCAHFVDVSRSVTKYFKKLKYMLDYSYFILCELACRFGDEGIIDNEFFKNNSYSVISSPLHCMVIDTFNTILRQ